MKNINSINSPQEMYIDMLEMFRWGDSACECEAEKMRAGIYCKTCKLFIHLREYTIQLFKDAAEGRSSYV
jgi:predicted RNA-binding Zn ribbon-like protein